METSRGTRVRDDILVGIARHEARNGHPGFGREGMLAVVSQRKNDASIPWTHSFAMNAAMLSVM